MLHVKQFECSRFNKQQTNNLPEGYVMGMDDDNSRMMKDEEECGWLCCKNGTVVTVYRVHTLYRHPRGRRTCHGMTMVEGSFCYTNALAWNLKAT